ncbi:MAG: threonine synthase [Candidatus Sumerlaeaceae bacterium]|nr:threonine synthase [Candidatus Sumerlaeaceae bacterium]
MVCPKCGMDEGILDVHFDIPAAAKSLTRAAMAGRGPNHWRYRELLPLKDGFTPQPEAIGWTPMLEAPRLAAALGVRRIRLKDDSRSASGSFKDRPSSVGVSLALQAGKAEIACASTGNAASSLGHCAAAAGLRANIFVSARIPDGKLSQLLAYGARVFKVMGSYDEAYQLCTKACEKYGWYNRNCAINPYLVEGKKTGGLEIAEQCADDPPDWVSASVGDGCSIAGVAKGIQQMREIGFINWGTKMLGVQAVGVAPIVEALKTGKLDRSGGGDTYADSINCPVPRNWRKAVTYVRDSGGTYVTVTDDEIREAVRITGRFSGVFAEPAGAAAVAGISAARRAGIISADASVVAVISGNGLKDLAGALSAVGQPNIIKPDFGEVERIVESNN